MRRIARWIEKWVFTTLAYFFTVRRRPAPPEDPHPYLSGQEIALATVKAYFGDPKEQRSKEIDYALKTTPNLPSPTRDPRLPAMDTALYATFRGKVYTTSEVAEGCFLYDGYYYPGLDRVAERIVGKVVDGFTFFGLNGKKRGGVGSKPGTGPQRPLDHVHPPFYAGQSPKRARGIVMMAILTLGDLRAPFIKQVEIDQAVVAYGLPLPEGLSRNIYYNVSKTICLAGLWKQVGWGSRKCTFEVLLSTEPRIRSVEKALDILFNEMDVSVMRRLHIALDWKAST